MGNVNRFEDLEIWKKAIDLTVYIYKLTFNEPLSKDYSLKDQIRRASSSVSNNIAEGYEYGSNNQFIRFLRIAKGSLGEVRSQIIVLERLNYINKNDFSKIYEECIILSKQIAKLISYLENLKKVK